MISEEKVTGERRKSVCRTNHGYNTRLQVASASWFANSMRKLSTQPSARPRFASSWRKDIFIRAWHKEMGVRTPRTFLWAHWKNKWNMAVGHNELSQWIAMSNHLLYSKLWKGTTTKLCILVENTMNQSVNSSFTSLPQIIFWYFFSEMTLTICIPLN
jgi:hypothetical protein